MTKKRTQHKGSSNLKAFLTTFLSILGFIIAMIIWRKDKYVVHYAGQSLIVFVFAVVGGIVQGILVFIPIIGNAINTAIGIIVFLAWIFSWIYALSGEKKRVPFIGVWGKNIKL